MYILILKSKNTNSTVSDDIWNPCCSAIGSTMPKKNDDYDKCVTFIMNLCSWRKVWNGLCSVLQLTVSCEHWLNITSINLPINWACCEHCVAVVNFYCIKETWNNIYLPIPSTFKSNTVCKKEWHPLDGTVCELIVRLSVAINSNFSGTRCEYYWIRFRPWKDQMSTSIDC